MAKVWGPLHSDLATGKFGGYICFCDGQSKKYVTRYFQNDRKKTCTEKQKKVRDVVKEMVEMWHTLSGDEKKEWDEWFDPRVVDQRENIWIRRARGYHLFLACNIQRKYAGKSVVRVPRELWGG
jgi:hypothetical protein